MSCIVEMIGTLENSVQQWQSQTRLVFHDPEKCPGGPYFAF